MVGVVVDKGDGRGLWGQGCVFADFMRSCWLSEGCGRRRRPCPRLMHSEPSRLAVVTAFSLKLAATLGRPRPDGAAGVADAAVGVEGGSEHSAGVAAAAVGAAASATSVADSEHSEHSEDSAGAGVALSMVGAGGAGAVSVGGVAAARIWAR